MNKGFVFSIKLPNGSFYNEWYQGNTVKEALTNLLKFYCTPIPRIAFSRILNKKIGYSPNLISIKVISE